MDFNFHTLVFLFFSFLGVLLAFFFFLRKEGDLYANRIIAFYTLFFSLEMFHGCLKWSGLLTNPWFTHLTESNAVLWMSYGPLVYLYVKRVLTGLKFKPADILLFIPSIIILIFYSPFYFKGTDTKIKIITDHQVYDYVLFPSFAIWIVIAIMFFFGIYTLLKFKDQYRLGYNQSLWLKWFTGSYLGFVFLFFLYVFLVRFNLMDYTYDYFVDGAITIFIVLLAYFGLVQPDVFNGKKQFREVIPFIKYRKSGLTNVISLELKAKLEAIMENEKPYLNNELRLNDLADLLLISRNQASQIINEHYNLSFFDFINKYRIEEAIKLLLNNDTENLNNTQIAYSSGFNNRASFYKAFKKFTNESPTTYLQHSTAS